MLPSATFVPSARPLEPHITFTGRNWGLASRGPYVPSAVATLPRPGKGSSRTYLD